MNVFSEGINGEFALGADDADWLLGMVEQSHQPFGHRPYVGDIVNEWQRRWLKSQPGPQREAQIAAKYSPNVRLATAMLNEAYTQTGKRIKSAQKAFPLEAATAAILQRWPGIDIGRPEANWNRRPEIVELRQMRMALASERDLPVSNSLKSGGHLATTWS